MIRKFNIRLWFIVRVRSKTIILSANYLIFLTYRTSTEYRPWFWMPSVFPSFHSFFLSFSLAFFLSVFLSFFLVVQFLSFCLSFSLSSPPIDRVPLKVGLHLYSMIVQIGLALARAKLQAWPASEFQPSILSNSSETGITYYPYYSKSLTKGIVGEYRPRFCWPWPWRHDVRICREFQ